jgi:multiple sugar transport system permease protein
MRLSAFSGNRINPTGFHRSQLKFYAVLLPLCAVMFIPVIFIFSQAFKSLGELYAFPPTLIVQRPTLDNFRMLFGRGLSSVPMSRYVFNSLLVSLSTVALCLLFTAAGGYALSKKRFRAKETLFKINQIALMFVSVSVTIPRYLLISKVGMMDTYYAHILPMLAVPVSLFLMKQFIDQIPDALIEAARIDGAGDGHILIKLIVPLIKPAIATVAILTFQTVWSDTYTSGYYMSDEVMRTLGSFFSAVTNNNSIAAAGISAAAGLVIFVPNLIIFIIMQSNVMSTMSHSGIK